mgnify:CR=1 FL=1
MMNKKFDGAVAPKHYESPSLAVLDVNLEMGFAQSEGQIGVLKPGPMSAASFFDVYGCDEEMY